MIDVIVRALAVVGALVMAALAWFSAMWALSRRADRKARAALTEVPPLDSPVWDRLIAALIEEERRDGS
ncbi:hypothetical protein ACQEUU_37050 [Nonomuraea sp. CA-218870]|uniref:hypothetical protein n=1 Tax=Nonomuraea sp. CA-218870 TaxID=3239998 RepID=UPI003D8A8E6E